MSVWDARELEALSPFGSASAWKNRVA